MFKHLLLPTDGSALSLVAIGQGVLFAKESGARVTGVSVKAADDAGVSCDTEVAVSDHPYEAIIRVAEKRGCDLIMMASHGRHGAQALLLGSETHKVLTHTRIPVLVYH